MNFEINSAAMLAEWLFVETVADVRQRSQDAAVRNRYELLGIAPLLRKLLLDARPLLTTISQPRPEISVQFGMKPWSARDNGSRDEDLPYRLRLGGRELIAGPGDPMLPNLKHFIAARVGLVRGRPLTVREVVKYYANVEGGVHMGVPREDAQLVLSELAPLLLGQSTGQIEILAHLGTIVVDALTPLCESILTSPLIDKRMHRLNSRGFYSNHWTADYFEKSSGPQ